MHRLGAESSAVSFGQRGYCSSMGCKPAGRIRLSCTGHIAAPTLLVPATAEPQVMGSLVPTVQVAYVKPQVVVECWVGQQQAWSQDLASVDCDLETRYLRCQQAELPFTLIVPDKGTVRA